MLQLQIRNSDSHKNPGYPTRLEGSGKWRGPSVIPEGTTAETHTLMIGRTGIRNLVSAEELAGRQSERRFSELVRVAGALCLGLRRFLDLRGRERAERLLQL